MTSSDDDWRLTGQEDYLFEAELQRKTYRVHSETWEHDHCEFCWAKFMDPTFSPAAQGPGMPPADEALKRAR